MKELIPAHKKEVYTPPLGRPYRDVWVEENFMAMLRGEEGDGAQVNVNAVCI